MRSTTDEVSSHVFRQALDVHSLGHRGLSILFLYRVVNLSAINLDLARRINGDAYVVALHIHDVDDDVVPDHDLLARLAREN